MAIDRESIVAAARQTWDSEPAIRAEFGDFERYRAYRLATAGGQVHIAGARIAEDGTMTERRAVIR